MADHRLSIKLALGLGVLGIEASSLFGSRLTKFGKENIEEVTKFIDIRLSALQEREGRNLLAEWREDADLRPKSPPALRGVLVVKSLALGRHLFHCLSLQKFPRCQVAQC